MTEIIKFLFPRSGATWLFWWTLVYMCIALYSVFIEPVANIEWIQMIWILVCSLPLWIPPLARFLRMRTLWQ